MRLSLSLLRLDFNGQTLLKKVIAPFLPRQSSRTRKSASLFYLSRRLLELEIEPKTTLLHCRLQRNQIQLPIQFTSHLISHQDTKATKLNNPRQLKELSSQNPPTTLSCLDSNQSDATRRDSASPEPRSSRLPPALVSPINLILTRIVSGMDR